MILTNDKKAYEWFKVVRYEGRHMDKLYKDDVFDTIGWNMYMPPNISAMGVLFLSSMLEKDNKEVKSEYQDLSKYSIYND